MNIYYNGLRCIVKILGERNCLHSSMFLYIMHLTLCFLAKRRNHNSHNTSMSIHCQNYSIRGNEYPYGVYVSFHQNSKPDFWVLNERALSGLLMQGMQLELEQNMEDEELIGVADECKMKDNCIPQLKANVSCGWGPGLLCYWQEFWQNFWHALTSLLFLSLLFSTATGVLIIRSFLLRGQGSYLLQADIGLQKSIVTILLLWKKNEIGCNTSTWSIC